VLYIIDLAGSERGSDSKAHTKELMEETKEINLSLMSLKECIRARTLASTPGAGASIHVPYRRSKLTLLMNDVFDIGCARICSTVVLAHVSPLAMDVKHTANTINYSAPLRVSIASTDSNRVIEKDDSDPVYWSADRIKTWCIETGDLSDMDVACLFPAGCTATGLELCQTSEVEIYRRLAGRPDKAKAIYQGLWTLICDAKVRKRRADGSIVTAEQEAAEIAEAQRVGEEKARVWAEREKHMRSDMG
jgi:kinesin family protein 2/24